MKPKQAADTGDGIRRAKTSVVLMADEVVVLEVNDPILWGVVYAAINSGSSTLAGVPLLPGLAAVASDNNVSSVAETVVRNTPVPEPINKFAKELGVDLDVLVGACDPTPAEPFLRLDLHHWEKMKKDVPIRGPKAIPPIAVAATILCLWSRHANLGAVTQAQAQSVLIAINSRDNNATRGIASSAWLQARPGGQVVLNPSQISKAICIVNAFCKQDWSAWKSL